MGRHKIKGRPGICVSDWYGGHTIYSGRYESRGKTIIWTQAGDDCEGNSNGNPAANIEITDKKIVLMADDGTERTWKVPEYKSDMKAIDKEIDEELERYYSQYIRQPIFIRRGSDGN